MARKRSIEKYKELLKTYNDSYRQGKPKISDEEFDLILEGLNRDYPDQYKEIRESLLETSGDFKHTFIAGSLNKIKSDDTKALYDWINKTSEVAGSYVITPKLDGLSMVLYYNSGKLIYAVTRGDGYTGIVQTEKIKYIVPEKIDIDASIKDKGGVETVIYHTLEEVPEWAKTQVKWFIDNGYLQGNGKGDLNISYDFLRTLIILYRVITDKE